MTKTETKFTNKQQIMFPLLNVIRNFIATPGSIFVLKSSKNHMLEYQRPLKRGCMNELESRFFEKLQTAGELTTKSMDLR